MGKFCQPLERLGIFEESGGSSDRKNHECAPLLGKVGPVPILINGGIGALINGRKCMGKWGYFTLKSVEIFHPTEITSFGAHIVGF